MEKNIEVKITDKILLTVEETALLCSISYNAMKEIMKRDSFPKVRNGNRFLAIREEIVPWLVQNVNQKL